MRLKALMDGTKKTKRKNGRKEYKRRRQKRVSLPPRLKQ
jgi:hypothetical protein